MPHRQRWRPPFIYSPADIDAVMSQARCSIASPLRAATYDTLIGLLAASGLRIGEAIKLDRGDVDWAEGVLLIRESKFGKSRLVPLHASTMDGAARATPGCAIRLQPRPQEPSFFVSLTAQAAALRRASPRPSGSSSTTPASAPARPPAAAARPAPHLRGPHPARLVSHRRGRPGQDPVAVDLPRAPRTGLAPTGICRPPRNCSRWPPPARTPRGRRPGHDPDRPDAAGVLHRPARPAAPGQPPHHRRLPRHPAAAARRSSTSQTGKRAAAAGLGRPGRHDDLRVPEPPGDRTAQQHPDPQRPPDRDPLAVLLRRAASPRARRC